MDDHRWIENAWVRLPAGQVLVDHLASLKEEPPVPPAPLTHISHRNPSDVGQLANSSSRRGSH